MSDKPMMVISIDGDGEVNAMHRDEFPLGFLGKQDIHRASEIIFDKETQKWSIYVSSVGFEEPAPPVIASTEDHQFLLYAPAKDIDGYNVARDVEVRWLEQVALNGCGVHSSESIEILKLIRNELGV